MKRRMTSVQWEKSSSVRALRCQVSVSLSMWIERDCLDRAMDAVERLTLSRMWALGETL
jgi:hypothetical protein